MGPLQSLARKQLYKGTLWHGERRHGHAGKFCSAVTPKTYVQVTQKQYNMDMLDLLKVAAAEHYAHLAAAPHHTLNLSLKALDPMINPNRPPESYKDAVSRKDREQWEEAMMKEYHEFQDMKSLAVFKQPMVGVQGGEWQAGEV